MARPFSDVTTIPIVGYKHPSDVPSEKVLSRLSVFGPWCDVPDTHTERKQGSDWRSQEAQPQVGKEAQKKDERNATGALCPGGSGGGGGEGGGGGGCTPRYPSEQNGHGREHAHTWTGSKSQRMTPVAEAPGDAMAVAGPTAVAVTAKCDNVVEHVEQYHLMLHRLRYIIDSILLCHLSEESIVSLHRFLCITRHVLPLLILSGGSAIKNLSRQPAAKTSVQDGLCKINNGKISTIKWYGSQTRTPSSSWSHAALIGLRVQRFLWLVCIRYL